MKPTLSLLLGSTVAVQMSSSQKQRTLKEDVPAFDLQDSLNELRDSISTFTGQLNAQKGGTNKEDETSLHDFDQMKRKLAGEPSPSNTRPIEIFDNAYDHYNHGNHDIVQGMEHIKVLASKKLKEEVGRKCEAGDYVTIHWKTFDDHNDKLEDSRNHGDNNPVTFMMGQYQVPKCWEIALVSLSAGEQLEMRCPSFYAYGGEEKYGHFGSQKIPAGSNLRFVLDVLNCESKAEDLDKANAKDENGAEPLTGVKLPNAEQKEDEKVVEESKEVAEASAEIRVLKDTVTKHKKELQKEQEAVEKENAEISTSDADDETTQKKIDKIMKKEEKLLKEKAIIDKEKTAIKKAEDAVDSAKKGAATVDEEKNQLKAKVDEAKAVKATAAATTGKEEEAEGDALGGPMGSMSCLQIVYASEKDESSNSELVLEVQQKDKYAPKNTGVYNVFLQADKSSLSKEADEKTGQHKLAQQWKYDADKQALFSLRYPEKSLFEGTNKNLIVYNFRGLKTQQFSFYPDRKLLVNAVTMRAIELRADEQASAGAEVLTAKIRPAQGLRQKFYARPCSDASVSITDASKAKENVVSTHKDSTKKVKGIDVDSDDEQAGARHQKEQEDKEKHRDKVKQQNEMISKANDDEDFDDSAPMSKAVPIADDKQEESDEAKDDEMSNELAKTMAAADNAVTSISQVARSNNKKSDQSAMSRSTEDSLATAKSMISSLVNSLGAVEPTAQKLASTKSTDQQTEVPAVPNGSREDAKAALQAKLATLQERQDKLLHKLSRIH